MTIIQKKRMELMERAITDLEKIADALKAYGQKKVMLEQGWDVDRFVAEFGKNYLTDRELDELDEERPFFADVLEDWIRESTSSVSADGAATFPASGEGFGGKAASSASGEGFGVGSTSSAPCGGTFPSRGRHFTDGVARGFRLTVEVMPF